jgi:hypothetical protein
MTTTLAVSNIDIYLPNNPLFLPPKTWLARYSTIPETTIDKVVFFGRLQQHPASSPMICSRSRDPDFYLRNRALRGLTLNISQV